MFLTEGVNYINVNSPGRAWQVQGVAGVEKTGEMRDDACGVRRS